MRGLAKWKSIPAVGIGILAMMLAGCAKSNLTGPSGSTAPVNMAISFSNSGSSGLMKTSETMSGDSLRIDSAVVVIARIKFESNIDTVKADTVDGQTEDLDSDQSIVFRGPYVIHVRDTVAINFANAVLPAGTYNGIKFKIHRLGDGEQFEDSDELNHRPMPNDSSVVGASITVWGAIQKNGVWTSFTYRYNGELEFKIKGTFTVAASTSTVNLALNFNMGAWFINPMTGAVLDPTDTSFMNQEMIRQAIYASFGKGKGGHDRGDGHPDDQ